MKKVLFNTVIFLSFSTVFLAGNAQSSLADESGTGTGHIGFTSDSGGGDLEGIQDPENPSLIVDPGPSPSTKGKLRIDFVPQLNFSVNKITDKATSYPVNAQLFHDETTARGNFVQVTDVRDSAYGWTLQLRQETQFQNLEAANSELIGSVLSFDKSWANSTIDKDLAPLVSKEVIQLNNIGETYNLATAESGKGHGVWSISFGASAENPIGMTNTLTPKIDRTGQPMLDPTFGNKQVNENSALQLSIPKATKISSGTYTTVLTWVLAELP
ncbi:WxL domain-containing protein [Enterococcus sp. AZ192]|uniref:WxL domain-containing protein n=1 Tax=unclassified Enterococcus TaxID=2608891 RepID=UPI003D26B4F9